MAVLRKGKVFVQPSSDNSATDLNNLVDLATIQAVGSLPGEIAPAAIAAGRSFGGQVGTAISTTPALRALGTGANDAAAGSTSGIATKAQFGATVIPFSATAPTTGQVLAFDGTQFSGVAQSSAAPITGTGTVTTTSASATVTGSGTKFLTELQVNYFLIINGVTWRVIAIASDTSLTVNAAWGADNSGQAFTYIIGTSKRPWNTIIAKSTTFAGAVTDAGVLYACDMTAGTYAGTLPAASALLPGDTLAFEKISDDVNTLTITCAGSDTFVDGSTTFPITTIGGSVTLQSDGVSLWTIVAKQRIQGEVLQSVRAADDAQQTINTHLTVATTPTTNNTHKITPLSLTLTTKSAFTTIRVRGLITGAGNSAGQRIAFAVFQTVPGPTTTLVKTIASATPQGPGTTGTYLEMEFVSGVVGAITLDLYIGLTTGSYFYLGDNTGASLFGGTVENFMIAEEVAI